MTSASIRESVHSDLAALESLYPDAFPDEDLVPLVRSLLEDSNVRLSLVATIGTRLAGHVIFTHCEVADGAVGAALLGPLAVAPALQRRGVGSALVDAGMRSLDDAGVRLVCVLGDPAYYARFGFVPEAAVQPPYPLPPEWLGAWQSKYLGDGSVRCGGELAVPPQWRQPALWAP